MRARRLLVVTALVVTAGCVADPHSSTSRAASPSPSPSERQCDASCLVVGPSTSVHTRRRVSSDLDYRLLLLDDKLTRESSDVPEDGEYLTREDLLDDVPATQRTAVRGDLIIEGFEGGLRDVWNSTYTSGEYAVALWRFARPSGALDRLKSFVNSTGDAPASTHQAKAAIPGGLAFLNEHVGLLKRHREFDEFFIRGRYLALVVVRSGPDLAGADVVKDGDILSKAQYDRMSR